MVRLTTPDNFFLKIFIFGPKMDQKGTKKGQKLVFFKYSHIIYGWKAYGKVITNFVKMCKYLHFWA